MDARALVNTDMPHAEVVSFASGSVALFTERGPERETPNEDALALIGLRDGAGVLVLADGAGGDRASAIAIDRLTRAVAWDSDEPDALRTRIVDGIEAANEAICELGRGAASTLAVAEIRDGHMRSYHVGDSMIFVTGQRGRVKHQTVSHSPVGYAVEAGVMDEAEAVHHEDRHVVSNLLGSPEMRIEIGPSVRLSPRDTLVLGSDGLFDNLYFEEIVERVRKGPLPQVAKSLVEACRRRMRNPDTSRPSKPDDMAFLVFRR
jgi:serine/threonine protein phosphatase PrpC